MAHEVAIEVKRKGRRPRYHRGAAMAIDEADALTAKPEQCNLDAVAAEVRVIDYSEMPALTELRRGQLCRRCWRGSTELSVLDALPTPWARYTPSEA